MIAHTGPDSGNCSSSSTNEEMSSTYVFAAVCITSIPSDNCSLTSCCIFATGCATSWTFESFEWCTFVSGIRFSQGTSIILAEVFSILLLSLFSSTSIIVTSCEHSSFSSRTIRLTTFSALWMSFQSRMIFGRRRSFR